MTDGRKHREEFEDAYARGFRSKPFREGEAVAAPPPRPTACRLARPPSGDSEPPRLQVQGFCCPLQQRPGSSSSGRATPQSRGGGDGTLPSGLAWRPESGADPAPWRWRWGCGWRPGGRPEMTPPGGEPVSEAAETAAVARDDERPAGAAKVSELHLYLPSSLGGDEDFSGGEESSGT